MSAVPAVVLISVAVWTRASSGNGEVVCMRRGDTVEIPCWPSNKKQGVVKWLHNNGSRDVMLLSISRSGVMAHSAAAPTKRKISNNSLVIDDIRKEDEGTYSCEVCVEGTCTKRVTTTVLLSQETYLDEAKELKAMDGDVFTHPCLRRMEGDADSSGRVNWTFESTRKPEDPHEARRWSISDISNSSRASLLSNGSIILRGVSSWDAGTYSCWRQRQSSACHWDRLVTITLQVQTAVTGQTGNDSQSGQNRSTDCDGLVEQSRMFCNHSKHGNTTRDRQSYNKTAVVLCTSTTCLCILIILCILSLSRYRRISAMTSSSSGSDRRHCNNSTSDTSHEVGEGESQVYSLLTVVKPEQNHTVKCQTECIYSVIKISSASDPVN